MKRLIIGGLAALAIGLTGRSAAAGDPPVETPAGVPFEPTMVIVTPTAPQTSCVMIVPEHWLCPEGVAAP
jgi:hypothetical protein